MSNENQQQGFQGGITLNHGRSRAVQTLFRGSSRGRATCVLADEVELPNGELADRVQIVYSQSYDPAVPGKVEGHDVALSFAKGTATCELVYGCLFQEDWEPALLYFEVPDVLDNATRVTRNFPFPADAEGLEHLSVLDGFMAAFRNRSSVSVDAASFAPPPSLRR